MSSKSVQESHRVVIVGGGFGGLYAAQGMERLGLEITLVDRRNFHLFQPLLYQVANAVRDRLKGRTPLPFRYRDKGSLAVIGRHAAVVDLGFARFLGPIIFRLRTVALKRHVPWGRLLRRLAAVGFVLFGGVPALAVTKTGLDSRFYMGTAKDLNTGEFLYWEEHTEFYRAGRHLSSTVDYRAADGRVFASKEIDFSLLSLRPDFFLEDQRNGYLEGAKVRGDSMELFWRRTIRQDLRSKVLPLPRLGVIDGGFDYFIRAQWDKLQEGRALSFRFAVPSELKHFGFRLRKERDIEYNGRAATEIYLEPSNFFVRLLVDPIVVVYDKSSKRLQCYEGMANINNAKGKSHLARIEFVYSEEEIKKRRAAFRQRP